MQSSVVVLSYLLMSIEPKVLVPANGAPPVGPYAPGLETAEYVYASGQGVRNSKSEMPAGLEAQTLQCIENVRVILEAAKLGLEHVSAVQLFVSDPQSLPVVEKLYSQAFKTNPPRVTLVEARMPTDTTVEITVVARKPSAKPANRMYLPAMYGTSAKEVETKLQAALQASGTKLLFANRYVVGSHAPGVVPVNGLPNGATHAIFAIAAKTPPADLAFCEVTASDPVGGIEEQTANVFGKLKKCLEAKGMSLAHTVVTNVYVDDLVDFTKMNAVYATFFPQAKPTRTTVQPLPPAKSGSLIRMSLVAAK